MKKIISLFLTLALCLAVFAGCSAGGAGSDTGESATPAGDTGSDTGESAAPVGGQLNLYTWEGMFPREILDGFEQETGITINYVNFDYDETMLTRLQAAGGGDYDLIIADDYIIETVIAEGLAQKLDAARLQNYGNINPLYQGQFFDPADEYTVPYGAGVQTIVYDPTAVELEIGSYADLWDPSLVNNVGIIANYRVINGMALKVLGESYNTEDTDTIAQAGEKLLELAPNIRLIKDDNLQDDLLSGEIGAAVMYTSQVTMAKLSNPELEIVYPAEGVGLGIMAGFVPSQAPNADAAYLFLDYILDAQNAAACFEWLGYYCTTAAAEEYIAEEYRDFLTLPADFAGGTEMIQNVGPEAEDLHAKIWTEFKAACGAAG